MKVAILSVMTSLLLSTTLAAANEGTPQQAPVSEAPLSTQDLAALSGGAGQSIGLSYQALSAANSGNSIEAQSVVTGNVMLQAGSLGGFNGVGNFVFNTGNNNNLQGALSVTIVVPAVN